MKPVLRYFGGKSKIAKDIINLMPEHNVYCEAYGGGASVLLNKASSKNVDIYNDIDNNVFNLFKVLRDEEKTKILIDKLLLTPFSREEFKQSYLSTDDEIESARRLLIRSYQGFSADATTGGVTGFRVDCSSSAITTWQSVHQRLISASQRFRSVVIENKPAIDLIASLDERDDVLFYLDPPYMTETRVTHGNKKGYSHEMLDEQHEELLNVILKSKNKVMISGYENPLYKDKLKNWSLTTFDSEKLSHRASKEFLWMNFETKQQALIF